MGIFLLIVFGLGFFALFVGGKEALSYLAKLPDASFKKAAIWLAAGLVATLISGYQLIGRNLGQTIPLAFGLTILALALNMLYLHRRGRLWNIGLIVRGLTILALLIFVGVNAKGAWGVLAKTIDSPKSAKATVSEDETVSSSASANKKAAKKKAAKKKGKKEKTSDVLPASGFPVITRTEAERIALYNEVSWSMFLHSMPSQADARKKAILDLGGPEFEDMLSFPREVAKDLKRLAELSEEGKITLYEATRRQVEEEIIRNPPYGLAFAYLFKEIDYVRVNNPWIEENIAKVEASMESGKGWEEWTKTVKISSKKTRTTIRKKWYDFATLIATTFHQFTPVKVDKRQTLKHWGIPPKGDASFLVPIVPTKQEKWEALIFVYREKDGDGTAQATFGVNIWDGRPELFDNPVPFQPSKKVTKASNPSNPSDPGDPGKPGNPGNPKGPSDPPKKTPTPGSTPPGTTPTPKPSDPPTGTPTPGPSDPPTGTPAPTPTNPTKNPADNPQNNGKVPTWGGENPPGSGGGGAEVTSPPQNDNAVYVPPVTQNPEPAAPGNQGGGPTFGDVTDPGNGAIDSGNDDVYQESFSSGGTTNIVESSPGNGAVTDSFVNTP